MNIKTIAIISLSAFVLLLVFIGAVSVFLKWRVGRPSNAVGPAFTSSTNKRSGEFIDLLKSLCQVMLFMPALISWSSLNLRMATLLLLYF